MVAKADRDLRTSCWWPAAKRLVPMALAQTWQAPAAPVYMHNLSNALNILTVLYMVLLPASVLYWLVLQLFLLVCCALHTGSGNAETPRQKLQKCPSLISGTQQMTLHD